ncbi:MAG: YcgN family cysteine cluster protein [Alphaproteobacteria bacterium]|nr:YcgN family cysteine cluster protein [Alphaproteobacteria bacterium]
MPQQPFWRTKSLDEMTPDEWEALCDGCAKCCLVKLEDEDTGKVHYTDAACALLDLGKCRCTDYSNRQGRVPDCLGLTPENIHRVKYWMPSTCAYRLLADGKSLPRWHYLECGDRQAVHTSGHSVLGRCVTETGIETDDLLGRIVEWPR